VSSRWLNCPQIETNDGFRVDMRIGCSKLNFSFWREARDQQAF